MSENSKPASEAVLGELHSAVATALTGAVKGEEVTAAMLGAAITFLKNNSITASPTENAELKELGQQLAARRRRKTLTPQEMAEASDQFNALNSRNGMPGLVQ